MAPRYSIVIPVYKNEETIPSLFARLRDLSTRWGDLEVVLVVDGSPDRSADVIRAEGLEYRFLLGLTDLGLE